MWCCSVSNLEFNPRLNNLDQIYLQTENVFKFSLNSWSMGCIELWLLPRCAVIIYHIHITVINFLLQYLPHIYFTESPILLQPSRQECVVSKHKFTKLITSMDGESERWSPQQLSWIKYLTDLKLMPLKLTENKSLVPWHYSQSRSSAIHGFMVAMPMLSRYLPHLLVFSI